MKGRVVRAVVDEVHQEIRLMDQQQGQPTLVGVAVPHQISQVLQGVLE
jgi:hypothetical protein